jgi:hypothetical protein
MPVPFSGYDLLLDDTLGLTLFRDGRTPAASGGAFGQASAGQAAGGRDQRVIWDRLIGGMGGTERLVPHSYPMGIDVTTRFGRVWTPGGEITRLGVLPVGSGGRAAGEINPNCIVEVGDDLLIGAGGVLVRLTNPYGSANMTVETTVGATEVISSIMIYQGLICVGTTVVSSGAPGLLYVKNGGSWAANTARFQYLAQAYFSIAGVGEYRLAGNDTTHTFKWIATTNPVTLIDGTAWTSDGGVGFSVGDATHPITALVAAPLVMYHIKRDGVFQMQPDGRAARVVDWSNSIHPNNGKHAVFAYGGIYVSHGRQGLVRVDVANQQVQWIDQACAPGSGMPRVIPINGDINSLTLDGEWLAGVVYNANLNASFVCYARPNDVSQKLAMETIQSPQSLNWHGSEASFYGQRVTAIDQASIGPAHRPLLWIGAMEGSLPVLFNVSLPALASPLEDWINGGPHRFTTQSWLYLPREDFGANPETGWAAATKVFPRLDVNAEYTERYVSYLDVYMSTRSGHEIFWDKAENPDATLWSLVGRIDDAERTSVVPPVSVQSGVRAAVMFRGFSDRQNPFAFNSAQLRALPLTEQAEQRRYRVTLAGQVRKKNRSLDRRDLGASLNHLIGLMQADPVSLLDKYNIHLTVKILEGMTWQEVTDPVTKEPTTMVDFTCRVMRHPFFWGTHSRWGDGSVWS